MNSILHTDPFTPNILIVDDVPANLRILDAILKEDGYKVRPVLSGIMALQVAEKEKPDLQRPKYLPFPVVCKGISIENVHHTADCLDFAPRSCLGRSSFRPRKNPETAASLFEPIPGSSSRCILACQHGGIPAVARLHRLGRSADPERIRPALGQAL